MKEEELLEGTVRSLEFLVQMSTLTTELLGEDRDPVKVLNALVPILKITTQTVETALDLLDLMDYQEEN